MVIVLQQKLGIFLFFIYRKNKNYFGDIIKYVFIIENML